MDFSHFAFSDESSHKTGRYRSLCLITFPKDYYADFQLELDKIFKSSGIEDEFKWEKVRSAKYRFAAEKIHAFVTRNNFNMRIDVLIWDIEDSRHKDILNRDDAANMERMYYHLLQSTLGNRWDRSLAWHWQPDEQSLIDWKLLGLYLTSKRYKSAADLFQINEDDFTRLGLKMITAKRSCDEKMIQLADFYAGLGAYSYLSFERFMKWRQTLSGQTSLFLSDEPLLVFTNAEKHRFPIIDTFIQDYKKLRLPISFESTRGFKTNNPKMFINFWPYQSQYHSDKAPTKTV